MPSTNDLLKLFSAIAESDLEGAKTVAVSIADKEAKIGHRSAGQNLRSAILAPRPSQKMSPISAQPSIIEKVLLRVNPDLPLNEVHLTTHVRTELLTIIEEYSVRWDLQAYGLPNRSRILLVGPPGCGKTASAKAVAHSLSLPIYVLKFDALIGSYLGQTSQNLSSVFEFIRTTPAVVLIDEIDAIASARGASRDVAELDRVVISLMQHLELVQPAGLLFCTSNLRHSIDKAVERRFDALVTFARPSSKDLSSYARGLAKRFNLSLSTGLQKAIKMTKSYAEAERVVMSAARDRALNAISRGKA